jgi:hypothetical protein
VAARAFVAKVAGVDACSFSHQPDSIRFTNFLAVDCFVATVPDTENDASLSRAVDLHPEITSMPAASHVICGDWFLNGRYFAIKRFHVQVIVCGIHQMHRSRIASFFHIEVNAFCRRTDKDQ